jgi:hypothetical protein
LSELAALKTRNPGDPAMRYWTIKTVADAEAFYQERMSMKVTCAQLPNAARFSNSHA